MRRRSFRVVGLAVVLATVLVLGLLSVNAGAQAVGGPVTIMGIDAEDGGVGGHGPITSYQAVVNSVLGEVANGGSGILVLGGGKAPADDVTEFWDEIGTGTSQTITYANGAAVGTQSFAGFAIVAVVSSIGETSSGGLTDAESAALAARSNDFKTHVNAGGGLIVFNQAGLATAYGFLGAIGAVTTDTHDYSDIDPTTEGTAVGITNALDVGAWHDTYVTFPSFLQVLAFEAGTQNVAALGGTAVVIDPEPEPEPEPAAAPADVGPVAAEPSFTG